MGRGLQKDYKQTVKYSVVVRPEAEEDLKEEFSWYEDNRTGLGYDFLLQVDAGINFIKRNPEINPIEYKRDEKTPHKKVSLQKSFTLSKKKR